MNSDELRRRFAREDAVPIFLGTVRYDDNDGIPRYVFEQHFEPSDDVLFIPELDFTSHHTSSLRRLVLAILEQEWGGYEAEDADERIVGTADGEDITRSVEIFRRPKESSFAGREP